jgi:glutathione peroxidase-family protein
MQWFEEKKRQVEQYEAQLKGMCKALENLSTRQKDSAVSHSEFADAILLLAEVESSNPTGKRLTQLADLHKKLRDFMYSIAVLDFAGLESALDEQLRTISSTKVSLNANHVVSHKVE